MKRLIREETDFSDGDGGGGGGHNDLLDFDDILYMKHLSQACSALDHQRGIVYESQGGKQPECGKSIEQGRVHQRIRGSEEGSGKAFLASINNQCRLELLSLVVATSSIKLSLPPPHLLNSS